MRYGEGLNVESDLGLFGRLEPSEKTSKLGGTFGYML